MNPDALLHWLLRTSLEGSLLIGVVLGLRWALRTQLPPAWRMVLWATVALKLLLPAFIPAGFGLGAVWAQPSEVTNEIGIVETTAPIHVSVASENTASFDAVQKTALLIDWTAVAAFVWITGVISVLASAIARQLRFERSLRGRRFANDPALLALVRRLSGECGILRPVSVRLMPQGTTPAVTGIRSPAVLLPEDWEQRFDDGELRHVLLHELHHVRRGDLIWNWVAVVVQALHWFNPFVWLALPRYHADAELRCDADAVARLSPAERLDYGHTLLRIQKNFFAPPAVAGLAPCVRHHPTLRQRIHMIAAPTTTRPLVQYLILTALGLIALGSFATIQAEEKELPPKERSREGQRSPTQSPQESERSTATREGERATMPAEREGDRARSPEREGDRPRTSEREGDKPRTTSREGDSPNRTGMREGDGASRTGARDGEGRTSTGERDGDRPRTGERDGDRSTREGMRDGDRPKTGGREGDRQRTATREGEASSTRGEVIALHVVGDGDMVEIGREKVASNRLRGFLRSFLPKNPGARVVISGDDDTPLKALHQTLDAVRDSGGRGIGVTIE